MFHVVDYSDYGMGMAGLSVMNDCQDRIIFIASRRGMIIDRTHFWKGQTAFNYVDYPQGWHFGHDLLEEKRISHTHH